MHSIEASIVISSNRPRELAEFYALALSGEIRKGITPHHYVVHKQNCLMIQVYRPSHKFIDHHKSRNSAICFQHAAHRDPSSLIKSWIDQLVSSGASVIDQPKNEGFGSEAWLQDPDGNYFLIFIPGI